jgi:uncharacterized protein YndB with AHSA1/START domain
MKDPMIAKKSIEIDAPLSTVWQVITDDKSIVTFMLGMKPLTDCKEGSQLNWIGRHEEQEQNMAKGHILDLKPNERLSYSFFFPGYGHADIPEHYQVIVLRLEKATEEKTILHAQQGDFSVFDEGATYVQHANDFWEQAVRKIKELAEDRS